MPDIQPTGPTLAGLFSDIASAIRSKTGTNEKIFANSFPDAIANIQRGVDTGDATATTSDIASGKTSYVNGEKITGVIPETGASSAISLGIGTTTKSGSDLRLSGTMDKDRILRANAKPYLQLPLTNLGTAVAEDVIKGKTFTSTAGVNVAGTAEKLHEYQGLIEISAQQQILGYYSDFFSANTPYYVLVLFLSTSGTTIEDYIFAAVTSGDIGSGKEYSSILGTHKFVMVAPTQYVGLSNPSSSIGKNAKLFSFSQKQLLS